MSKLKLRGIAHMNGRFKQYASNRNWKELEIYLNLGRQTCIRPCNYSRPQLLHPLLWSTPTIIALKRKLASWVCRSLCLRSYSCFKWVFCFLRKIHELNFPLQLYNSLMESISFFSIPSDVSSRTNGVPSSMLKLKVKKKG